MLVAVNVPTPPNRNQQVIASVYAINVFNDERDDILKKWNMLQACWGTGKGYYNSTQPPVDYTAHNPFYRLILFNQYSKENSLAFFNFRFKAMGYNVIPEQDNSEGIVKLVFNKKIADLRYVISYKCVYAPFFNCTVSEINKMF